MRSPTLTPLPRVAFACSGLGWVKRGNETWASKVTESLHQAKTPVTLWGGGPLAPQCHYESFSNLRRETPGWRRLVSWHHRYLWEQRTFFWKLRRRLHRGDVDLVQVADPLLAELLRRESARTRSFQVIYKDGLLLGPDWCHRFPWVQVLTPYYLENATRNGIDTRSWKVIPHLVDVHRFSPPSNSVAARRECPGGGLPPDPLMVLAVGDFSTNSNKRLETVVEEVARCSKSTTPPHLVVAGQSTPSDQTRFESWARPLLGNRLHLRPNLDPEEMPKLYAAADLLAHAAVREPFGIIFLEAMASGLPIVAHSWEVTRWIIGNGGQTVDTTVAGEMASVINRWHQFTNEKIHLSRQARARAVNHFAPQHIVPLYQSFHEEIRAKTKRLP